MPQLSRCTVWGEKAGRQTATYTAALRLGRAVLDPLSRAGADGLPLPDIDRSTPVGDPQHPAQTPEFDEYSVSEVYKQHSLC